MRLLIFTFLNGAVIVSIIYGKKDYYVLFLPLHLFFRKYHEKHCVLHERQKSCVVRNFFYNVFNIQSAIKILCPVCRI